MRKSLCHRLFQSLLLLVVLVLPMVGCEKDSKPQDRPAVGEFKVTIEELTSYDLTFTITPPASTPVFTVKLMPDNDDLDISDLQLAAAMVSAEDFTTYEGQQRLTFGGLVGNSNYRLIYFAYDVEHEKLLSDLYRSEVIRTPESEDAFEISITDITGLSANITITPPDNELTYFFYLEDKADYDTAFGGSDQGIIENDIAYWEFLASMYDGATWLDFVAMDLSTGTQSFSSDEIYGALEWDSEYLVYAYGLNEEGVVTHSLSKRFFSTKAPEMSDNTFELEMGDIVWDSAKNGFVAHATVTPKNLDETYYAVITNKDWYDWYFTENNKGRSDNKYIMYQLILNCPSSAIALSECKMGVAEVNNADWANGLRPEREYAFFIFGFGENGATTDLSVFPFTTPTRPY